MANKRVNAKQKGKGGVGQRKHQLKGLWSRRSWPGLLEMSRKTRRRFLSK